VLLGSSRMLLDVDLDVLRNATGLEPVQLAIDGSAFLPVLEDLAADNAFRGTVLVGYEDNVVASADADATAASYVAAWQREVGAHGMPTFASIEGRLTYLLHASLRSYADGARPGTSMRTRALAKDSTPQYLITFAHRERIADYARVPMPGFYFTRVLKELHEDIPMRSGMTWGEADKEIRRRLDTMPAADDTLFRTRLQHVAELVGTLKARGAKVGFVELPASGLIRAMEDKRYPKDQFWDRLVAEAGAPAMRTRDDLVLATFNCPDGSHIDVRDRARFTTLLAAFVKLGHAGTR
jgi:hypothetical protein